MAANAVWYHDSQASDHVTTFLKNLDITNLNSSGRGVKVTNGNSITILHLEKSSFPFGSCSLILENIHHVPSIKKNLLSVNKLCVDNNVAFQFDDKHVFVKDQRSNEKLAIRNAKNRMYELELQHQTLQQPKINNCKQVSLKTWHNHLGYICENKVRGIVNLCELAISNKKNFHCKSCVVSKMHRLPYLSRHD